jgi:Lrp/AsnC family transcriptional regulator, leucine-responsive regulatory protein
MQNGVLDEIDIQIMQLLQGDARLGVVELTRMVNLTKTPLHKRIRKLQTAGYIRSYVTLLDREKIGQPVLVVMHVRLKTQTKELLEEFEATANQMSEVQFLLHVSGSWDFILHITAKTPQAYYIFLMERICALPNVAHVESSLVMKECKSYGPFRLE